MNKKIFKIISFLLILLIFSGCSLNESKKTQLEMNENQKDNSLQESIASTSTEENQSEIAEEVQQKEKASDSSFAPNVSIDDNSNKKEEVKTEEADPKDSVSAPVSFKIKDKLVSWGFQKATTRKIDTVIIHSSYNSLGGDIYDLDKILDIYKSYGVAPHYIIARNGQVYRLVEDKNIAYHAGEGKVPDGRSNVNSFSIGIEIVNSKTESPTSAQYENLKKLVKYLEDKYDIKYVLGHSDIASGRKDDPWKFDWDKIK